MTTVDDMNSRIITRADGTDIADSADFMTGFAVGLEVAAMLAEEHDSSVHDGHLHGLSQTDREVLTAISEANDAVCVGLAAAFQQLAMQALTMVKQLRPTFAPGRDDG